MNRYTLIQALIELQKQGKWYVHLFFSCKNSNHYGRLDISDYDWELQKEIREVLDKEKEELEFIENKYKLKTDALKGGEEK